MLRFFFSHRPNEDCSVLTLKMFICTPIVHYEYWSVGPDWCTTTNTTTITPSMPCTWRIYIQRDRQIVSLIRSILSTAYYTAHIILYGRLTHTQYECSVNILQKPPPFIHSFTSPLPPPTPSSNNHSSWFSIKTRKTGKPATRTLPTRSLSFDPQISTAGNLASLGLLRRSK